MSGCPDSAHHLVNGDEKIKEKEIRGSRDGPSTEHRRAKQRTTHPNIRQVDLIDSDFDASLNG